MPKTLWYTHRLRWRLLWIGVGLNVLGFVDLMWWWHRLEFRPIMATWELMPVRALCVSLLAAACYLCCAFFGMRLGRFGLTEFRTTCTKCGYTLPDIDGPRTCPECGSAKTAEESQRLWVRRMPRR
jgi:hypothetical protein